MKASLFARYEYSSRRFLKACHFHVKFCPTSVYDRCADWIESRFNSKFDGKFFCVVVTPKCHSRINNLKGNARKRNFEAICSDMPAWLITIECWMSNQSKALWSTRISNGNIEESISPRAEQWEVIDVVEINSKDRIPSKTTCWVPSGLPMPNPTAMMLARCFYLPLGIRLDWTWLRGGISWASLS